MSKKLLFNYVHAELYSARVNRLASVLDRNQATSCLQAHPMGMSAYGTCVTKNLEICMSMWILRRRLVMRRHLYRCSTLHSCRTMLMYLTALYCLEEHYRDISMGFAASRSYLSLKISTNRVVEQQAVSLSLMGELQRRSCKLCPWTRVVCS